MNTYGVNFYVWDAVCLNDFHDFLARDFFPRLSRRIKVVLDQLQPI